MPSGVTVHLTQEGRNALFENTGLTFFEEGVLQVLGEESDGALTFSRLVTRLSKEGDSRDVFLAVKSLESKKLVNLNRPAKRVAFRRR